MYPDPEDDVCLLWDMPKSMCSHCRGYTLTPDEEVEPLFEGLINGG